MRIDVNIDEAGVRVPGASIVVGSSLIYSNDLTVAVSLNPFDPVVEYLQEEVTQRIQRKQAGEDFDFQFVHAPMNIGAINGAAFPLCTLHPYNYYHFLIEALPDLLYFLEVRLLDGDSLIVTGNLHDNMRMALSIVLGSRRIPTIELVVGAQVSCREVLARPGAVHGSERIDGSLSPLLYRNEVLLNLRRCFSSLWAKPSATTPKKIYVLRNSYQRHLTNSTQLAAMASKAGYVVIQPEMLSLVDQISIFSGAERVIGPTGAWLANLLFVNSDARVTVLSPTTCFVERSLWRGLGEVFGINVTDAYGEVVNRNERQPIHSDFACSLKKFETYL